MGEARTLTIEGMDCPSCASKIEGAVCRLPGVGQVSLNYGSRKLTLDDGVDESTVRKVKRTIEKLGYGVQETPGNSAAGAAPEAAWWQTAKGRLAILSGGVLALAAGLSLALPGLSGPAFALAALVALAPLARKAVMSALAGQPFTIETLVVVAVFGAIWIGQEAEAAVVVFLFLIGELLERTAAARARSSVQALSRLVPRTAFLVADGTTREVPANRLRVSDVIEVRPGGRVPADGVIVQGEGALDEALITGESVPVHKAAGAEVFAGSINADSVLRVKVSREAADNTIARIQHMVEEAEASKARVARFIDEFSRSYTPGVMLVSALIAIVPPLVFAASWEAWIYKGLAILLIGCPCALVLSTPAAITSGISAGARQGLLVKGGAVLEAIGRVRCVAFDKTGTLTRGRPSVTDVQAPCSGADSGAQADAQAQADAVLALAAAAEAGSAHPLAGAIRAEARARALTVPEARNARALGGRAVEAEVGRHRVMVASARHAAEIAPPGAEEEAAIQALERQGKTVVVVLRDDRRAGIIALRDALRDDARTALARLADMGVSAVMLTGDNRHTGAALASELGIDVVAELLPEDKLEQVERLGREGPVAMVGDGINDAPALARADVGIAMGGGTDVALETADAALLHERLGGIAALVSLSRATMANVRQNITMALGLKAVFLVTTLFGVTSLWMAILADTGATILVTGNAMRLLRFRFDGG